jgi:hypothetical protein
MLVSFDTIESSDALLAVWVGPKWRVSRERQSRVRDKGQGQMGSLHITTIAAREVVGVHAEGGCSDASRILLSSGQRVMVVSTGNSSP